MRRKIFLLAVLCLCELSLFASNVGDTLKVQEYSTPLLINKEQNVYFDLSLTPQNGNLLLKDVVVEVENGEWVKDATVYYTGTRNLVKGNNYYDDITKPSYSIEKSRVNIVDNEMVFNVDQKLFPRINHFVLAVTLKEDTPLDGEVKLRLKSANGDKSAFVIDYMGESKPRKVGVSVRNIGDDGVSAYRIPGLVTTKKGTLVAVYDIRRNSSVDLQEDIQVGVSRSIDGGRTWQPMQIAIDMRGYGDLPDSENGVGDPAILVDEKSGDLIVIGLWSHGLGGSRNFWGSRKDAMLPEEEAAQIVIARSSDDGATWSEPQNITSQIRDPRWGVNLQGPGCGITMSDGTLVFAFQYLAPDNFPHSTIIYSKDRGESWSVGNSMKSNTTEAQIVEVEKGVLMINARDNRKGSRSVYTTKDLGETWVEHSTSRKALIEPVCQASILKVKGKKLIFCNPNDENSRVNMTIKGSEDGGESWNDGVLLDSNSGWGYSCMTMIDSETVGVLYEGSQACLQFQAIPLVEIFNK